MSNDKNLFWFENVEFRDHPWPGLMWITPSIQVPDVQKARDLYVQTFNFVSIYEQPNPQNELVMTRLRYRGTNFVLMKEGPEYYEGVAPSTNKTASPFVFYVYVDDVNETYQKALMANMTSLINPSPTPWGDFRARLQCPFGYVWDIAMRVEQ